MASYGMPCGILSYGAAAHGISSRVWDALLGMGLPPWDVPLWDFLLWDALTWDTFLGDDLLWSSLPLDASASWMWWMGFLHRFQVCVTVATGKWSPWSSFPSRS